MAEETIYPSEDCREYEQVVHRTDEVGLLRKRVSNYNTQVICTSSGKTRRFIPGVKAGFALTIINQKLGSGNPLALYIEVVKEGEEPLVFASDSLLRICGDRWKFHTVIPIELICTSSGKTSCFFPRVKAGFALTIINQKLGSGNPLALYIEVVKEGEKPIIFCPDSLLRCCGDRWKLHTVVESQGHNKVAGVEGMKGRTSVPVICLKYIGKTIILAFLYIFLYLLLASFIFTLETESVRSISMFIVSVDKILNSK